MTDRQYYFEVTVNMPIELTQRAKDLIREEINESANNIVNNYYDIYMDGYRARSLEQDIPQKRKSSKDKRKTSKISSRKTNQEA